MHLQPDINRLVASGELRSIGTDKDKCEEAEKLMRENRLRVEPYILEKVGLHSGRKLIRQFENAIARLVCGKSMERSFVTGVSGKYESEKMDTILSNWLNHIAKDAPLATICSDLKIETFLASSSDEKSDNNVEVDS